MRLKTEDTTNEVEELKLDILKSLGTKIWKVQVLWYLLQLRNNLGLNKDAIGSYQDSKVRKIVSHAYRTVPFYQKLFKQHHIEPDSIRRVSDLCKLPIIDKDMLRNIAFKQKISRSYLGKHLISYVTGGSTGKPFTVYLSEEGLRRRSANHLRIFFLHGYSVFDKVAKVEGIFYKVEKTFLHKMGVLRKIAIPCDIPIAEQTQLIAESKPEIVEGYPSRLSLISKNIKANHIQIKPPKAIFTNSETLLPDVRERIEETFGVKVTNVYDSHEFAQMGWECSQHSGFHINSDSLILQVVKNNKELEDGQCGEIVITDLNNYAMPFIRYRIGDIGVKSAKKCKCGIAFPLLQELMGRSNDILFSPQGAEIAPLVFDKLFRSIRGILEYQVVQNSGDSLDIAVVASGDYDYKGDEKIKQQLANLYGFAAIRVNHPDQIKRTVSGKLRCYVCNFKRTPVS